MERWLERWHPRWRGLIFAAQQHPPRFVEAVMMILSILFFAVWLVWSGWPYLVLYASYMTGAIASVLARELTMPSQHTVQIRWAACLCGLAVFAGVSLNLLQIIQ